MAAHSVFAAAPALRINEILFNPPGTDLPNEYIELRGTPNLVLPAGTFLLSIEGNAGSSPGTIENLFDLSGRQVGGNGFLVLLQKGSPYSPDPRATILMNTNSGDGWGSGASSSIGHKGKGGLTELKNPSVTFFLIQTTNPPSTGTDLDNGNTGVLDPAVLNTWTVLDSIGVLDGDGAGDFAYGALNYRLDSAPGNTASASGLVVPVSFVPRYAGRAGNSSGSTAADWVVCDAMGGLAPDWTLAPVTSTYPTNYSGLPLNHLGAANFGAPALPGVYLIETAGATVVTEGAAGDSVTLGLNTMPAGTVTVQMTCGPQLEVSVDGGTSFGGVRSVVLSNTAPTAVQIRAKDDQVIDASPHDRFVTNTVTASGDPAQYPVGTLTPILKAAVLENHPLLLSELKVNPPGTDAPWEFIEVEGPAGALLTNVYLAAVEGNSGAGPGKLTYVLNLSGVRVGTNGVVLVMATNAPYAVSPLTTVIRDARFNQTGGALGNGSIAFLLVRSPAELVEGVDLDQGNDGILEGLSPDAVILDAVGWSDGDKNDLVYGGVDLTLGSAAPDAATRFPGNLSANSASAWFSGKLLGVTGDSLTYDESQVSLNFPPGSLLTPGSINNTAPVFAPVTPVSGVINDPFNPPIRFSVSDRESPAGSIVVTATSTNPAVVPNTNLVVTMGAGGVGVVHLAPVGVGYSDITLWASDGSLTGKVTVPYAASAPVHPGTVWHLGASDGSTALLVDADYLLLGDDENQVLRLYDRHHSDLPLNQFDFTPFLALPDLSSGLPREVDVEASTRVGNRLFWMGSLGHAATGESRTNRTRVFVSDLAGTGTNAVLTYAGRYDFLKVDLINWDSRNLHGKGTNYYGLEASDADGVPPKAPDGSGFAVEGLSMMPGNTNGAYVAFRAPIVPPAARTYALVVPVLNFAAVAASSGPPGSCVFGAPIELDLYGRGIRSLEGTTNGYLIVGGPAGADVGRYPMDFRLYTWSGLPQDKPQQRTADLSGLNPEGIVELPPPPWTPATEVELLSDNGGVVFYGDDIKAKKLTIPGFKKCRSDRVTMGSITKPMPVIVSTTLALGKVQIRWRALEGESYRIQSATDLDPGNWTDVSGTVVAPGPYVTREVDATGPRRFYRIVLTSG